VRLLLATQNKGKLRELEAVLGSSGVELATLAEFGDLPPAIEDAATFEGNARKKALHYWRLTNVPSIADDSGLVVDALGGRPGVLSARYGPDDKTRIERLLGELEHLDSAEAFQMRTAHFVCAICVAFSENELVEVLGEVSGYIAAEPRGESGFGYDPIFYYPPAAKTFAEMEAGHKNSVSHRAKALTKLRKKLLNNQRVTQA
jgi:XTP/dITP diphosphohydrolase